MGYPTQFVSVSGVDRIEVEREDTGGTKVVRVTLRGKDDNMGIQILAYPTDEVKPHLNNKRGIDISVKSL